MITVKSGFLLLLVFFQSTSENSKSTRAEPVIRLSTRKKITYPDDKSDTMDHFPFSQSKIWGLHVSVLVMCVPFYEFYIFNMGKNLSQVLILGKLNIQSSNFTFALMLWILSSFLSNCCTVVLFRGTIFTLSCDIFRASLVAQTVKHLPAMQETWVWSLGREDSLEKGMATHSSIHAWKISWMEPGGYSPWGHKESVMGYHGSCYGSFLGKHVAQRNMFFQFHIFGRLLDYLQQILMSFSCANLFLMLFLLTVFTTSFFLLLLNLITFPPLFFYFLSGIFLS